MLDLKRSWCRIAVSVDWKLILAIAALVIIVRLLLHR